MSVNLQSVGDFINVIFVKKYNDLMYTTWTGTSIEDVKKAIIDAFSLTGITIDFNLTQDVYKLQPCDVIRSASKFYCVTSFTDDHNFTTFPRMSEKERLNMLRGLDIRQYSVVKRPNLENISSDKKAEIDSFLQITSTKLETIETNDLTCIGSSVPSDTEGFLQIGDVILTVDPTQISFATQNGYQYFPTIRTQGSPKVPTMQQVKNIGINLIFPNQDSINYQLLHIFAMYKRTPFVNIRNKDICNFFKELTDSNGGFLSVALESISIQSIDGFPNSLQAQISLLPFDPFTLSNGFRTLRSLSDVQKQQRLLYGNSELKHLIQQTEEKMETSSIASDRLDDNIVGVINTSYNFQESLPFRAFYQSLIKDRTQVLDEHGNAAILSTTDNLTIKNKSFDIKSFAPTLNSNFLQEYSCDSNIEPISLEYSYIPTNAYEFSKKLSNLRIDNQLETLEQLTKDVNLLIDKKALYGQIYTRFRNLGDFYKIYENRFNELNNTISNFCAIHNLNVNGADIHIKNIFDLLTQVFLNALPGINPPIINAAKQIGQVQGAVSEMLSSSADYTGLDNYTVVGTEFDVGNTNIKTARAYMDFEISNLWQKLSGNDEMKRQFVAFLYNIGKKITDDLSSSLIQVDPAAADGGYFKVQKIPIMRETDFTIDNEIDVVTSWNLTFSNQFVPFQLVAFKYPFYQHIGSNDISISLVITSTSSNRNDRDLKSKLSLLSERLYESVKITTLNAPELITYLDPRIKINVPQGHIFKVFGIENVVLNSTNTTNIQGSPDSWNTIINFTQANFTLDQYHKLLTVHNYNDIELELAKIVSRLSFENNKVVIYKFQSLPKSVGWYNPGNEFTKGDFVDVTDLDEIIKLNFIFSKHGESLIKYLDNLTTTIDSSVIEKNKSANESAEFYNRRFATTNETLKTTPVKTSTDLIIGGSASESYYKKLKEVTGGNVIRTIDGILTTKFQKICENKNIENLLKFIVSNYDMEMEIQSQTFQKNITEKKTYWQNYCTELGLFSTDLLHNKNRSLLAIWLTFIFAPVAYITHLAGAGIRQAKQFVMDQTIGMFETICNNFKRSKMVDLAHQIMKDPIIREQFIGTDILGARIDELALKMSQENVIGCYEDFDIPHIYLTERRTSNSFIDGYIKLAPDFFIYNNVEPDLKLQGYINSGMKRIAKTGKLHIMTALFDSKDILTKFDAIFQNLDESERTGTAKKVGELIGWKDTLDKSLENLQKLYYQASTGDYDSELTEPKIDEILKDYDDNSKDDKRRNLKQWEQQREYLEKTLMLRKAGNGNITNDADTVNLNLVLTARNKLIVELFALKTSINQYYTKKLSDNLVPATSQSKKGAQQILDTKDAAISEAFKGLNTFIDGILDSPNIEVSEEVNANCTNGSADSGKSKKEYVTLPGIKSLQNYVYTKVSYLIRLNQVITEYNRTGMKVDLSSVPEIGMLGLWNCRNFEGDQRLLELQKQLLTSNYRRRDTTLKMFPTFKLYFIEEDKGIYNNLDEYYAYNAIQSIETTTNKNSASSVTRIVLSNITGTITDQLSFLREKSDLFGLQDPKEPDNAFFGTLDVKPGTSVMIKMGYSPTDTYLDTLFIGRILEMNVGPVCEIIAQSYGAQLNSDITQKHFGMFAKEKAHGDIATSLLDTIPGLENLGKTDLLSMQAKSFSGKGFRKWRGTFADRFLMTNLLGSISAIEYAYDNPRDENIYLPYDAFQGLVGTYKPTFDWVVYQQSVWEALQEITLYNRNTTSVVKKYNLDQLSGKKDIRETLVIGDKSGYYKYTDSFGLSTIDTKTIDDIINKWNSIKDLLRSTDSSFFITDQTGNFKLSSNFLPVYKFFQNELSSKVVLLYLLKHTKGVDQVLWNQIVEQASSSLNLGFGKNLGNLLNSFYMHDQLSEVELQSKYFGDNTRPNPVVSNYAYLKYSPEAQQFIDLISSLRTYINNNNIPWDITPEEVYEAKATVNNTDNKLALNPQYKKIQNHHLITDTGDILSNNIALSNSFYNTVNVYYLNEPQFITEDGVGLTKKDNVNLFTVKSFGDLKDDQIRQIDSFQKNIDTNWWAVAKSNTAFFENFKNVRLTGKDDLKKIGFSHDNFELDKPSWFALPSYYTVATSLLKREVSKMYQGTIEIVGNPSIEPLDILHIEDYTNDMHGCVEVEEVTHIFTPDRGFRTVITPNLLTYDRDPIQLQDVQVINNIYNYANTARNIDRISSLGIATIGITVGSLAASVSAGLSTLGALAVVTPFLWNGTLGVENKYNKFLYESIGEIMGRDCINFTTLLYHGSPYISGFDGVDYTNMKTLINHKIDAIQDPITRYAAFSDPWAAIIATAWKPGEFGIVRSLVNHWFPGTVEQTGFIFGNVPGNFNMTSQSLIPGTGR